jgi:endogenous inhibitor of DNA gyrase (YacG/DUF329 family)
MRDAMKIQCPRCGQETSIGKDNAFRPFCSERCRLIDLGRWMSNDYCIPDQTEAEEESAPISPPPSDPQDL